LAGGEVVAAGALVATASDAARDAGARDAGARVAEVPDRAGCPLLVDAAGVVGVGLDVRRRCCELVRAADVVGCETGRLDVGGGVDGVGFGSELPQMAA
jgi:hypothetical protein